MVNGEEEIRQSLQILINTLQGERVLDQEFGCSLRSYAFESISETLLNEIRGNIQHALVMHERRIELENIEIKADEAEQGLLQILVEYSIPNSNSRYNMVFPYYLAEADNSI